MDFFRRALDQTLKNPKYMLAAFAVFLVSSIVQALFDLFVKNDLLNTVGTTLTESFFLLMLLILAVNVYENRAFSWKALSRLPRAIPALLASLISVAISSFYLWIYDVLFVSSEHFSSVGLFLAVFWIVAELVIAYLSSLWVPLYFALRAKGEPHALASAGRLFAHPIHLLKSYFITCWVLIVIRVVVYLPAIFGGVQAFVVFPFTILFAPITALLTFSFCDEAMTLPQKDDFPTEE